LKKKAEQEAKDKAEADRKAKEAKEQAQREASLKKALQAEREAEAKAANTAMVQKERSTWISAIGAKVQRAWTRDTNENVVCDVYTRQTRDGDVKEVRVQNCQGDASDAYKRSVELAVRRASPLPKAPSDEVFKSEIIFIFRPQ
jgi:colicin import membrane protein